jgi:hypothetical protein
VVFASSLLYPTKSSSTFQTRFNGILVGPYSF